MPFTPPPSITSILTVFLQKHLWVVSFSITFLTIALPAWATGGCPDDLYNNIPAPWKEIFPFDMIFPIGEAFNNSNTCPIINFLGVDRQVCSIGTITAVVKNIFLFKVVKDGLFNL